MELNLQPASILSTVWAALFLIFGGLTFSGLVFAVPKSRPVLLFIMVFTFPFRHVPFLQQMYYTWYRGMDRGFTVALSDTITFAFLLFILLGGQKGKTIRFPKGIFIWSAFLIWATISAIAVSEVFLLSSFALYKLVRVLIYFWVISNLCRDRRNIDIVIYAFLATAIHQGIAVLWYKYVTFTVVARVSGTFAHSNGLGMYMNAIMPLFLVLMLGNFLPKKKDSYIVIAAILFALLNVLFTKSRGSIVICGATIFLLAGFVFMLRPTGRKFIILTIGFVVLGVIAALALPKIIDRFENAGEKSGDTRDYFNNAATHIADDHLMGCGVNMFPYTIGTTEYYWDVYPDVADQEDREEFRNSPGGAGRLGIAHHAYNLVAAETGWIGFGLYILFLARIFMLGIKLFFSTKDPWQKHISLGVVVGMATMFLQSLLEFFLNTNTGINLFITLAGILVGIDANRRLGRN